MRYGETMLPGQVFATAADTLSHAAHPVRDILLGSILLPTVISTSGSLTVFISLFRALSTLSSGLSLIFAAMLGQESITAAKIAGMLIAISGVVIAQIKPKGN
jgi:hypothetical protein